MKAIEALKQVEIQGMDNTMYSVEELPFYEGMSEDEGGVCFTIALVATRILIFFGI